MRDYTGVSPVTLPDPKDPMFVPRVRSMLSDIDIYLREVSRGFSRLQQGQVPDGSGDSIGSTPGLDAILANYFYLPGRTGGQAAYGGNAIGDTLTLYPSSDASDKRLSVALEYASPAVHISDTTAYVAPGGVMELLRLSTSHSGSTTAGSEMFTVVNTHATGGTIMLVSSIFEGFVEFGHTPVVRIRNFGGTKLDVMCDEDADLGVVIRQNSTSQSGRLLAITDSGATNSLWRVNGTGVMDVNPAGTMAALLCPILVRATDTATPMTRWKNSSDSVVSYIDHDGTFVGPIASTGSVTFSDSTFRVNDNTTPTKQLAFECSGITAGNTRTVTIPDASGTLAYINTAQTFTKAQTLTPDVDVVPLTINQGSGTGNITEINISGPVKAHLIDALGQAYYNGTLILSDGTGADSANNVTIDGTGVSSAVTWSFPNSSGTTFVGTSASQNLTNKSIQSGTVSLTGQTASITTTNITVTPSATAVYLVEVFAMCTTASGSGSPTLDVTIGWTDTVGATTQNVIAGGSTAFPMPLSATGRAFGYVLLRRASGNITYATTINAASGSPQYALNIRVLNLG